MSLEFSNKCSQAQKERFKSHLHPFLGRKLSDKHKQKIKDTMKLKNIRPTIDACKKGGRSKGNL